MNYPRSAFGASPSRGRHQRPGKVGSAVSLASAVRFQVATGTPEALSAFMQAETAKWARVVKESGVKLD